VLLQKSNTQLSGFKRFIYVFLVVSKPSEDHGANQQRHDGVVF
jgi:hypothetical protein